MKLAIYQVDAFAKQVFQGNPAAVIPLNEWLPDERLQQIAQENNLSETAFFVKNEQGYDLRWFTPAEEVNLCGHATLATAHVIFQHLGHTSNSICFASKSGELVVEKNIDGLAMNFPATMPKRCDAPQALLDGLNGTKAARILADFDYVIVVDSAEEVIALQPDFTAWNKLDRRGVIVTAKSNINLTDSTNNNNIDFVSRCFYPILNVEEDPVTGSAHCIIAPYWAEQLNKKTVVGKQVSARSGEVHCQLLGERIILTGQCVDYMQGEITLL